MTSGAETLAVATFNTELSRKGPGILLRDILRDEDTQVRAVVDVLIRANADVVALQGVDYDLEGRALAALADLLRDRGLNYPHVFAAPPNAGRMTDQDLDGDGITGGAGDAQGYGRFFGAGAMAILSRFPIDREGVQDFSALLWRDLPGNMMLPAETAAATAASEIQRLPSHGHWVVPVIHPSLGRVHVMTFHASPPVFDGPEDRNGRRNHDEVAFWTHYLAGSFGPAPQERLILMGDANLDPERGDGRGEAMRRLLDHPLLQDPLPGAATVDWAQTGPMRVDYILPSVDWRIVDAGIAAPDPKASRHRLVWVTLTR